MTSALANTLAGSVLSGVSVAAFFGWLLKRQVAKVTVKQEEATLADQISGSAKGWIRQQDERVNALQKDLEAARAETAQVRLDGARELQQVRIDSAREVQQLREALGRLSQELNAFRLGVAAPLGYVIVPRALWVQVRMRDAARGELPSVQFPGEDVTTIVRDLKDPPEGGGT